MYLMLNLNINIENIWHQKGNLKSWVVNEITTLIYIFPFVSHQEYHK